MSVLSIDTRSAHSIAIRHSSDVISASITSLIQEHIKGSERGVFWNEELKTNEDPLQGIEKGFWGAPWDLKVQTYAFLLELFSLYSCLSIIAQNPAAARRATALSLSRSQEDH